jgi:ATP-dependent RNA helicase
MSNPSGNEDFDGTPSFEMMGLKEELLRGIFSYGYEHPSGLQEKMIEPILKGHHLLSTASTGIFIN